jgi:hypothetical protein
MINNLFNLNNKVNIKDNNLRNRCLKDYISVFVHTAHSGWNKTSSSCIQILNSQAWFTITEEQLNWKLIADQWTMEN